MSQATAGLRLLTFGGLSVQGQSGPLTGAAAQPRRLAVLALVARGGERGVNRNKVLALLWPDADDAQGRRVLSQALYSLRRDLGNDECIRGTHDLRLNVEEVWCDVAQFERALDLWPDVDHPTAAWGADRAELLARAATAAYLAGFMHRDVAFQRQVVAEIDAARDPVRAAVMRERLGRYLWFAGDAAAAITELDAAIALLPADPPSAERARVLSGYGQLLMLLDRFSRPRIVLGSVVATLVVYVAFRRLLYVGVPSGPVEGVLDRLLYSI